VQVKTIYTFYSMSSQSAITSRKNYINMIIILQFAVCYRITPTFSNRLYCIWTDRGIARGRTARKYSESEGFDFIYAISVFTHIDEEMQNAWIQELHRVLKPKGILLISVLGPNACKNMPKDNTYRLESQGFVFVKLDFARGIFPNWYQLSYHTEGYVRQKFGKYFNLLSFMEKAVFGFQDVALLEKK
jgi:SAM-dependent methyltransferase